MKKLAVTIAILIFMLCSLSACGEGTYADGYDDGFEDGYSEGRWDALLEHEDDYIRGYEEGYDEGYDDSKIEFALNLIEEAESYARNKTGYSVYEAWNDILIYQDRPEGFEVPTEEEYIQCVETLVYFCAYLDDANFYD